jgi:type IV pilus assembly protein PilC
LIVVTATHSSSDALFTWKGRDRTGQSVEGEERAVTAADLSNTLRARGIFSAQIHKKKNPTAFRGSISGKDLTQFTRQLATMVRAGVPMLSSFEIAARSARNPQVSALIEHISHEVQRGIPLHKAFAQHPKHFGTLYCASIASGEASGSLDKVLEGLALHLEKAQALQSKVRSALMYPAVVSVVTMAVVAIIMVWVVPAFESQFNSFGATLPGPTLIVVAISKALLTYGWLMALALVAGAWGLRRAWQQGGKVRSMLDRWTFKIPAFGPLMRKAVVARWTRTMSTMSASGVPLLDALAVVGHAAGNQVYVQGSAAMAADVANGVSLSQSMRKTGLFPPTVLHMCILGEESGTMDSMLSKSAEVLEAEVDDAVAGFSSILEPIMIVVLGAIIGGIVLAMYLPIFQLGRVI